MENNNKKYTDTKSRYCQKSNILFPGRKSLNIFVSPPPHQEKYKLPFRLGSVLQKWFIWIIIRIWKKNVAKTKQLFEILT